MTPVWPLIFSNLSVSGYIATSQCLMYLVFANTNFHFSIRNPTYITGKCQNLHTCNVLIIMVNIRQVNHMLNLKYFEFNIFKYAFELVIIINHQYIAIYLGIRRWLANVKPNRFIILLVLDRTTYLLYFWSSRINIFEINK